MIDEAYQDDASAMGVEDAVEATEAPEGTRELLAVVQAARQDATSLENSDELRASWEKALRYYKGDMPEIPALEGRSQATSSDLSDAVEAVMPDLLEIFLGGDDVATLRPRGQEDEEAAQQETDYVNHVVMDQNDGFDIFSTAFKDALLSKIGIFKAWREEEVHEEDLRLVGKTAMELEIAKRDGWTIKTVEPSEHVQEALPGVAAPAAEPLYDAVMTQARVKSRVCVATVTPDHFGFAKDAVKIRDAAYCYMKSYPRAQDLLARGYPADLVADLPAWSGATDSSVDIARDTAGESDRPGVEGLDHQRQVEIIEHYIRLYQDGKLCLYRVVTGGDESVLLESEKVARIPFAIITPYTVTHRLLGRSLADLLFAVQEIRTVLTRMMLDSGYFAINQRHEINMADVDENTLDDYLDNRPNRPVRSKSGNALKPINAAGLSFDAFGALEYTATLAEQRTGVVRNAQGLNPDTLHDTAAGAKALVNAAQKRVRMIARTFAETGVKDLFLNVHALLREGPAQPAVARLRGRWVNVSPSAWGVREDMDIQIGIGSGGREHDLLVMQQVAQIQAQIVQGQGGPKGPMIGPAQIYNAAKRTMERAGLKGVEQFILDPKDAPPAPPAPPPQDPAIVKLQHDAEIKKLEIQADIEAARMKAELDAQLRREEMKAEDERKRDQLALEYDLKREQLRLQMAMGGGGRQPVRFGGGMG